MIEGWSLFLWNFNFWWYECSFAVLAHGLSYILEDYIHFVSSSWVECGVTEEKSQSVSKILGSGAACHSSPPSVRKWSNTYNWVMTVSGSTETTSKFPVWISQSPLYKVEILPMYIMHVLTVLVFFKVFVYRQRLFCGRLLWNVSNQYWWWTKWIVLCWNCSWSLRNFTRHFSVSWKMSMSSFPPMERVKLDQWVILW